jgi:hypothetical protein
MKPYKSILKENNGRRLSEGFALRPFTKNDWMDFNGTTHPPNGASPMIGELELIVENQYSDEIDFDYYVEEGNFLNEDGDLVFESSAVTIDADHVWVIAPTSDGFSLYMPIRSFEDGVKFVQSKFYKQMNMSYLLRLGFKSLQLGD